MTHALGASGDVDDGADRPAPTRASLILGLRRAAPSAFVVGVEPACAPEEEGSAKRGLADYLADLGYSGDQPPRP
ncbi:hypothetical protein [Saccharothrix coeruleofusca]|uniref:Uncharacterized protein n=1 Tax=Saccharothrix coeruleofusca TaxID=33919 RepID=A0A918AJU1_9PSEU|nr:hypothetical protein [Saccharothrix coeruleofusca]MBP2338660.1 hypothetical protein [Saccharothrix coeruleofusca]GGP46847.1 hypothetical protein GCM10010185_18260 [Saccharothrix coeruleofusca]